jgi:hypothetical protein
LTVSIQNASSIRRVLDIALAVEKPLRLAVDVRIVQGIQSHPNAQCLTSQDVVQEELLVRLVVDGCELGVALATHQVCGIPRHSVSNDAEAATDGFEVFVAFGTSGSCRDGSGTCSSSCDWRVNKKRPRIIRAVSSDLRSSIACLVFNMWHTCFDLKINAKFSKSCWILTEIT